MNAPVYGCDGCRTTAGAAGCSIHGRTWSSSPIITHCPHGLDLRLYPRCYLCSPEMLPIAEPEMHSHDGLGLHRAAQHHTAFEYTVAKRRSDGER